MSHAGHGRTVYSCGCVASQCRCMGGWGDVKALPYPCANHAAKAAAAAYDAKPVPVLAFAKPGDNHAGETAYVVPPEQDGDATVWPPAPRPTR